MISKEELYIKEDEFGTPYTLSEARKVAEDLPMDEYIREIMCWLIYEVERLQKEKEYETSLPSA